MSGFWLFVLVIAIVLFLIGLGYLVGRDTEQEELETQRQVLDAEWTALEQTRHVNDVFYRARDAMRQAEADAMQHDRRQSP